MEVHHHPHVEKKNFKEYFLEFLMIFLAVTLGFFAENIREHSTDRSKEKEYMQSMLEDLKSDTATITGEMEYADSLRNGLGITFNAVHNMSKNKGSVQLLYEDYIKYQRLIGFNFHDATETEMKNADGLRLIEKKKVTEKIIEYWKRIESIQSYQTYFNDHEAKSEAVGDKIFDRTYITEYNLTTSFMLQIQIDSAAKLITNDSAMLLELGNGLWLLRSSLDDWYIPGLQETKQVAIELIDLIKKEYHLEKK